MKRFYLLVLVLLAGLSVQAKNKISMVTYFPVPYVAFPQIASSAQMDIGLTQSCDMTLGCTSSETTLFSPSARLTNGRLNLNGGLGISGGTLALGAGSSTGSLQFRRVRFQTAAMTSMVAGSDMSVSRQLILFTKTFPSCKGVGNGIMRWEKLKLSGAGGEELYLVCGGSTATPPALGCSDNSYKLSHKSECCPATAVSDTDCWTPHNDDCYTWQPQWQSCSYRVTESGGSTSCMVSEGGPMKAAPSCQLPDLISSCSSGTACYDGACPAGYPRYPGYGNIPLVGESCAGVATTPHPVYTTSGYNVSGTSSGTLSYQALFCVQETSCATSYSRNGW